MNKLMILVIVLLGCMVSRAFAYTFPTQSVAEPSYQFRSTSAYPSLTSGSTFASSEVYAPNNSVSASKIRKSGWDGSGWDEDFEDNDPIGISHSQPVGEPLVLLLIAGLYIALRSRRFVRKAAYKTQD